MQCPEVEGSDKLVGQMLEVEVASLQVSYRVHVVIVMMGLCVGS